ncbi:YidC/Oxa1 family membrane protein insertase [Candidatus Uhrbacteria bacterium]|nr:YidC/Oxa1 family membrane protein insertase [Candidatus Uhrbacteria bacterium]
MFWDVYLYTPLVNALMFLYGTIGLQNLGLAVVWLTVLIRFVLIVFTLIVERNKIRYAEVNQRIPELQDIYRNDPVTFRDEVRTLLRKQHINHWASFIQLGVQALVLVLLYNVFMAGIKFDAIDPFLYPWVPHPDQTIDTTFLNLFDVAERNVLVSAIIGLMLYLDIWMDQRSRSHLLAKSDLVYRILFPLMTFVALWILPSVKALFILTSILFSLFFHYATFIVRDVILKRGEKGKQKKHAERLIPKSYDDDENPLHALRKGVHH